jgi:hypothetical protein
MTVVPTGKMRLGGVALASCAAVPALVLVALFAFAPAIPGNIDDAFIVLVYARHLLRDGKLFWNAGDGPVEGFTSPLDVIVKAIGSAIAPGDPLQAAFWISLLLHCACPLLMLVVVLRLKRDGHEGWRWAVALTAALCVAASRNLAFGSSFLLETPLFVASALVVLLIFGQPRIACTSARLRAGVVALAALFLSRPEGVPLGLTSLAFLLWHQRHSTSRKALALLTLGVGVVVVSFMTWRLASFGEWAPNTYYAKSSSSRWNEINDGVLYVRSALGSMENVVALGAVALGWMLLLFRSAWNSDGRTTYFHVWSLAAVSLLSVVWSGGDCYAGGRFLAVPSCLAVFLLAVGSFYLRRLRWLAFTPLVLLLFFELADLRSWSRFAMERMRSWPISVHQFTCQAQAMRRVAAVSSGIAVMQSDCQRFKFFADSTRVIDLEGFSDRRIAHQPAPGHVVWGRYSHELALSVGAPVWVWGWGWWSPKAMSALPLSEIVVSNELIRQYTGSFGALGKEIAERVVREYTTASVRGCGMYFNFLVRKDYVAAFRRAGISVNTAFRRP